MRFLKTFKLFEAFGVAEVTLVYNDFLVSEFHKYLDQFLKQDGQKDVSNIRTYQKEIEYSSQDLSRFIEAANWPDFPISSMVVNYDLGVLPDKEFSKRYPKTSLIKNYSGTGAYYEFNDSDGSLIQEPIDDRTDVTIKLKIDVGAQISNSFNDIEGLLIEIESSIAHELNHAYESWMRYSKGKGGFSTDITWSSEVNRARIRKDIFEEWTKDISFFLYWSEPHEMNAMVQDSWPYVKRYEVSEMKEKTPTWRFSKMMLEFSATDFKKKMSDIILSNYPDADVDMFLKRIKNGFANELLALRDKAVGSREDKSSISGDMIKKMSVDEFLKFVETRSHNAGKRLQNRVLKLYSLKLKYNKNEKN